MAREGNEKIWKVAVLGAAGRMGSEAVRAVNTSADMDLVAALGRGDDLQELVDAGAEIVIDLTVPRFQRGECAFRGGARYARGGWYDRLDPRASELPARTAG